MKQAGAEQVVEPVVEPVPVDEDYGDEDLDDDEKVTYRDYLLEKPKTPREKKKPKPKKPYGHDASMQELSNLFPTLHQIPYEHYHTTGAHAIVEVGNVVTKVNMIRDHRAFNRNLTNRGFFYIKEHVGNM